ncbi:unnamed protein product [Penicillium nalgiovense]|uniref:Uncharacterized protein n=1 Tax=Penicillium nalgiovense TaxID=60175 RepID=A0A1V6Z1H0_PENNA|nr:hypothetical protein PENNAL_c0005G06998 [Penicillium nalgiovense]CAG7947478.1 unnamed protein product [Penicillium nalgiovense]CAG7948906.1 unnamed protein product [Penicillium nalgiovense]CAG7959852.1 unnamed protein product [Penicillium nalgiovense]CAG7963951.1 unnamed protein product [Penicillium nalgiovense]
MIWLAALPEKDSPAFTPYQGGSWSPSPVPATGVHFGEWKYCFDLDMFCVKIPLASVNDEAHDVAITWAHKQGIEVIFDEKRRCNIYIRRPDPMRSFCGDVVMFIITGKHPAFDVTFGDFEKAPPRWVLDATHQGESIVWDRTIERLEMRSGNQLLNDHSYERVIEAGHAVSDHLAAFTRGVNYFEIRAAHAIKL